jgi:hypothetical protein
MSKRVQKRYPKCADLLIDLRALKKGETPPIAHKDTLPQDDLALLAAAEASAVSAEIPQDVSRGKRLAPGWVEHLAWPPFLVLAVLFIISLAIHIIGLA